jgi:hypothetical protein
MHHQIDGPGALDAGPDRERNGWGQLPPSHFVVQALEPVLPEPHPSSVAVA